MLIASLLLAGLAGVTLPSGSGAFFPAEGQAQVAVTLDAGGLRLGTVPVERTGWLLAGVASAEAGRALAAAPGVAEAAPLDKLGRVWRVHPDGDPAGPAVDEFALSRALHGRPGVRWAHPDLAARLVPQKAPNDPYYPGQWHLHNTGQRGGTPGDDIKAEAAWDRVTADAMSGAKVAVLDTGVDFTHPDLVAKSGHDYVGKDEDSSPDPKVGGFEHGTAVSGIIAAQGDNGVGVSGVAWGASVYAVRLIGGQTSYGDFYGAVTESVDAGAWVLNNSWGYDDPNGGCVAVPDLGVFHDVTAYAETMGRGGLGSVIAFAAGNGNCDIAKNNLLAQPEIVVVAASGGDDLREGYSSFGKWVKVAGPSGNILTTDIVGMLGYGDWMGDNDYSGYFNGTSAATPVVSGVLLLMFASNPRLTAAQARAALAATASKIDVANGQYDATGWSPYYGFGRVDVGAAVAAVQNSAPGAPTITAPVGTAYENRVVLAWTAAVDADHDQLTYQVSWQVPERGLSNVVTTSPGATFLDVTGAMVAGETVAFTVQAFDPWGPGPPSAPSTFSVIALPSAAATAVTPAPAKGCGCRVAAVHNGPGWGPAALLSLCFAARFGRCFGRWARRLS